MTIRYSASQIKTHERCSRLWYLEKVEKVPSAPKQHFKYGTILHEVLERYGLGQSLYPDGWDNGLSQQESQSIVDLVNAAIKQGLVVRSPDQKLEEEFELDLGGDNKLVGFIDVLNTEDAEVLDYKTTKNLKYAKTAGELREDPQMIIYGKVALDRNPKAPTVALRHLYFCKDPYNKKIKPVGTVESRRYVTAKYEELVKYTKTMGKTREYDSWDKVPEPEDTGHACNMYGGCDFRSLCSGQVTLNQVKEMREGMGSIFKRAAASTSDEPKTNPKKKKPSFSIGRKPKISKQKKKIESAEGEYPWADKACETCNGKGLNSNNDPCRTCLSVRKAAGEPHSDMFAITMSGDKVLWSVLDDYREQLAHLIEREEPVPDEPEPSDDEVVVKNAEEEDNSAGEEVPLEPKPQVTKPMTIQFKGNKKADVKNVKMPQKPENKKRSELATLASREERGVKKGFVLMIGTYLTSTKNPQNVIHLSEVIQELGEELVTQYNSKQTNDAEKVESVYEIDTWEWRQWLCAQAGHLLERFGRKHVYANPGDPDTKALISALRAFAAQVYEPILH